jgi:hypothetical protein
MNATTTVGDGRDRGGRFAKGNPGGPGRPPRTTEANYLIALTDVVPLVRHAGVGEVEWRSPRIPRRLSGRG